MAITNLIGRFPKTSWKKTACHLLVDNPVKVVPERSTLAGRSQSTPRTRQLQHQRDVSYYAKHARYLGLTLANRELHELVEELLRIELVVHLETLDMLTVPASTVLRNYTSKVSIVSSDLQFAYELCDLEVGVREIFPQLQHFVIKERANPNHYLTSMVAAEESRLTTIKQIRDILTATNVSLEVYLDFFRKHGFVMGWTDVRIQIDPNGQARLVETWKTAEADFDKLKETFDNIWGGSLYKPLASFFKAKLRWPNPNAGWEHDFEGPWFESKSQGYFDDDDYWTLSPMVITGTGQLVAAAEPPMHVEEDQEEPVTPDSGKGAAHQNQIVDSQTIEVQQNQSISRARGNKHDSIDNSANTQQKHKRKRMNRSSADELEQNPKRLRTTRSAMTTSISTEAIMLNNIMLSPLSKELKALQSHNKPGREEAGYVSETDDDEV